MRLSLALALFLVPYISRNSILSANPQPQLVARRPKVPSATSYTFRLFSLNNIHFFRRNRDLGTISVYVGYRDVRYLHTPLYVYIVSIYISPAN